MLDVSMGQNLPVATIRLRTVLLIRWIAAAGQLATVLIVHFGLDYALPLLFRYIHHNANSINYGYIHECL